MCDLADVYRKLPLVINFVFRDAVVVLTGGYLFETELFTPEQNEFMRDLGLSTDDADVKVLLSDADPMLNDDFVFKMATETLTAQLMLLHGETEAEWEPKVVRPRPAIARRPHLPVFAFVSQCFDVIVSKQSDYPEIMHAARGDDDVRSLQMGLRKDRMLLYMRRDIQNVTKILVKCVRNPGICTKNEKGRVPKWKKIVARQLIISDWEGRGVWAELIRGERKEELLEYLLRNRIVELDAADAEGLGADDADVGDFGGLIGYGLIDEGRMLESHYLPDADATMGGRGAGTAAAGYAASAGGAAVALLFAVAGSVAFRV
jgi:hypothetical protein